MHRKVILDGFPILFDDELLYGALARFADRVGYVYASDKRLALLGLPSGAFIVGLPASIRFLASQIPKPFSYTAKYLVLNHTLFPYYTAFMNIEDRNKIYRAMLQMGRKGGPNILGSPARSKLAYLRFCPLCAHEDIKQFNEAIYHRSHQIPLINVCYKHQVFLCETSIAATTQLDLISAKHAITTIPEPKAIDLSNPDHAAVYRFAKDAHWLLTAPRPYSLPDLRDRYFAAALESGLVRRNTIAASKVFEKSLELLSRSLQNNFHISFSMNSHIIRFLYDDTRNPSTIQHLALLYVIGTDLKDFWGNKFDESHQTRAEQQIAMHKEIWLQTRAKYPEMSVSELRQIIPNTYRVLWKKDKAWYESNKPASKYRKRVWHNELPTLDLSLVERVNLAGNQLLTQPAQITIGRLCKEVGILEHWFFTHREDLPLTDGAIQQYLETPQQYFRRRITLDMDSYYDSNSG